MRTDAEREADAVFDRLLCDCADAGVFFRLEAGRLNPRLTRGNPPGALLERVTANREKLALRLALGTAPGELAEFGAGMRDDGGVNAAVGTGFVRRRRRSGDDGKCDSK